MSRDFDLGDYIDVPTRIAEFRAKYPEGSLQPADLSEPYRVLTIGDRAYVVVVAAAYRSPDDTRPGIGMAYEQWPGRTPYTKDSELQNAETSAWGRAIVAALAADTKKGIASAEDVRNRRAEQDDWEQAAPVQPASKEQAGEFTGFQKRIAAAPSKEELFAIGGEAKERTAAGGLTQWQYSKLANAASRRLAALRAQEPPQAEQTPEGGAS